MITRLPGSKWWGETDDVTNEIIGTYNAMYQAYQGEPQAVEVAQLIAKRDALIALRDRLI